MNIETQTLATNSAESAGKDYVSCLNVMPESNFTKSNTNVEFMNQAYIQLIPNKMDSDPEILESLLEISSYKRMIRVMAWVLQAATIFKGYSFSSEALDAKELARGEALIQTFLQCKYFSEEIRCVHKGVCLPSTSCLNGLHPFIDSQQGILRLSSRLGLSELPYDKKYPIILPRSPHVVALIRGVHLENNP